MDKWLQKYGAASTSYAVCRYLETMGSDRCVPELQSVVEMHDERTGAMSDLPLA